jgi:hypothetical protein
MLWKSIKTSTSKFRRSFHQSGVIVFARLQLLLAAVWTVLTTVDLAPLIGNPKYVTAWLVFSGIVTETARRSRTFEDPDTGHLLPRQNDDQTVNVTINNPPAASAPSAAPASPVPTK